MKVKRIATFKNLLGELEVTYTRTEKATKSLKSSHLVYEFIRENMPEYWRNRYDHEQFHVICFNRQLEPVHTFKVSQGGDAGTAVDIKTIFRNALVAKCSHIIVTHNHPSCSLRASVQDISLTQRIKKAGEIMDIPLLDHIIIAGDEYYSFKDSGDI